MVTNIDYLFANLVKSLIMAKLFGKKQWQDHTGVTLTQTYILSRMQETV